MVSQARLPYGDQYPALQRLAEQLLASNKCLPVYLEPELRERFYKGFCKQQLWPLLHYVLPMSPHSLGRFNPDFWQSYVRANMIFADRLTEVVRQHCDFVWIHDYHLMVLPSLLRRRLHKVCPCLLHPPSPASASATPANPAFPGAARSAQQHTRLFSRINCTAAPLLDPVGIGGVAQPMHRL